VNVEEMNRDQLRQYARDHKIPGYSKLKVADLRTVVAQHAWQNEHDVVARSYPYNGGRIYPTGPLGTYCNDPQLATHLPGFREDR
jgi:hypothetical protein